MQTCFSWSWVFIQSFNCHDFSTSPLLLFFCCFFKNDATMTICKIRGKPFDVLIKNRSANMTSVDWATRLINECGAKGRKRWPTTDKRPASERKLWSCRTVCWNTQSNCCYPFWILKTLHIFCILNHHKNFCGIVNVALLNTIQLLKQTWSLLARRGSQTEGSSAN